MLLTITANIALFVEASQTRADSLANRRDLLHVHTTSVTYVKKKLFLVWATANTAAILAPIVKQENHRAYSASHAQTAYVPEYSLNTL